MTFDSAFDKPKTTPSVPYKSTQRGPIGSATPYGQRALDDECAKVSSALEGTRNDTLNRSAIKIAGLVASGEIDERYARQALADADGGQGYKATDATIDSAFKAGLATPRYRATQLTGDSPWKTSFTTSQAFGSDSGSASDGSNTDTEPSQAELDAQRAEIVKKRLPLLDWADLWSQDDKGEEWIIDPILPARRLVALYSLPKVGKSLLMLEMACAIARGVEVLGATPPRQYRVLYVDFENDPRGDIRARLRNMRLGPDDLSNLCYLSFPTMAAMDTERGALELLAAVAVYQCEVVVIDTVSRAIGGDENENDTWLDFYRHTGLRLKQAGVAMIRLDHSGKDETKGQRGGSAKSGDVDAVWRMSRVAGETFRLTCEASRFPIPEAEKLITIVRVDEPYLHHKVNPRGSGEAVDSAIAIYLDGLDTPLPGINAIWPEAKIAVPGLTNRRLRDAIERHKNVSGEVEYEDER